MTEGPPEESPLGGLYEWFNLIPGEKKTLIIDPDTAVAFIAEGMPNGWSYKVTTYQGKLIFCWKKETEDPDAMAPEA